MSTAPLHQIAENDTPTAVQLPSSLHGLVVWAMGRTGGGILPAASYASSLSKGYKYQRTQTDRMRILLEGRAGADSQLVAALFSVKASIKGFIEYSHPILS